MSYRIMKRDNLSMETREVCTMDSEKAAREALAVFQNSAQTHEFYWAEKGKLTEFSSVLHAPMKGYFMEFRPIRLS